VAYDVRQVTAPAQPTAVVARVTTWEEYPAVWRELLDEVYSVVRGPGGSGQARWQNIMLYLDDRPSVEVGVLIEAPFTASGRVVESALPAGALATTVHRGPYEGLGDAHRAVIEWCAARDLARTGVRWEIYGHWHEDPEQLETEICWQLA
jgi:effector-binding domain-containing protein